MRIAFFTYSYIDRLAMDPVEVLEAVAAAGYQGVDLSATWRDLPSPADFPPETRRRTGSTAARLGLTVEAVVTHLPLVQSVREGLPLDLPAAVDLAREWGCSLVTVHPGGPVPGQEPADAWRLAVDALQGACAYAERKGIAIAVDAVWPGTIIDTPQAMLRLAEDVGSPALKHNYDPCYLAVAGFDPVAALQQFVPLVVHAHVKDYTGAYPGFEHHIPGEGILDHAAWVQALRDAGFDGSVAVECFTHHPFDRALQVGLAALSN